MDVKHTQEQRAKSLNNNGIRRQLMAQITAKQEKAIMELLRNPTVKDASQKAQVGERTLWRWLQDDDFRGAYMEARKQAFSRALGLLQQALSEAVLVLKDVMNNPDTRDSSRVSSAKAILDTGLKAMELDDLEERISRLESMARGTCK